MQHSRDRIVIASDVDKRDGIGVEFYRNEQLVLEIFRDDTLKTRTVTVFHKEIELDFLEKAIETFKKEIPWDFIED